MTSSPNPHPRGGEGHCAIGDGNPLDGLLICRNLGLKAVHLRPLLGSPAATFDHSLNRVDFLLVLDGPAWKGCPPDRFSPCNCQMLYT
jgi:hypothetical protein